ncbi:MAG: hypothetical protein OQJ99_02635 [Rhodospirillales bacterium]|nr:hypothetical protein [Rhodospirillales bacterium]MCW8862888.1 hypothetical protein [Rhodospirillales bacterium]MCW8971099.1 hypothetical protein [Rhodospirillales bacterium]MCW9002050.1 hypothetical protein [Rhodospirillales bacterium]
MRTPAFLATLALIAGLATPSHAADGKALSADSVRGLLSGNTLIGETLLERFKGKVFHVFLKDDGTLVIRNFEGGKDTGTWEVTAEGHYCSQYRETRKGMRRCYAVKSRDGKYLLENTADGSVTTVFTVAKGNAEGL